MGNVRTSTMYINNQQEVVVVKTDDGIQIKHRLISDDPSKPNSFSNYLYIPDEDLEDFLDMIEKL
jgi:hypothetical protein